jgi:hypothetical protein
MAGARQRQLRLAAFAMHGDFAVAFVAARMPFGIDTAPMFYQPVSKCCGFHLHAPVDQARERSAIKRLTARM